jgi:hypothetical protein
VGLRINDPVAQDPAARDMEFRRAEVKSGPIKRAGDLRRQTQRQTRGTKRGRQKKELQSLLAAGARLRKAQEKALSGGGSDALLAAQAEERESVRDLTQRAAAILEEAGRPPTRAVLERIRATLGAAVLTDPERAALKAGRLTSEVQVSGFDALTGIRSAPPKEAPRDELAERRRQKAERERKRKQLEKRARDLADKAAAAEEAAEQAEEKAADARELADDRRHAADLAADELAEFERSPG